MTVDGGALQPGTVQGIGPHRWLLGRSSSLGDRNGSDGRGPHNRLIAKRSHTRESSRANSGGIGPEEILEAVDQTAQRQATSTTARLGYRDLQTG